MPLSILMLLKYINAGALNSTEFTPSSFSPLSWSFMDGIIGSLTCGRSFRCLCICRWFPVVVRQFCALINLMATLVLLASVYSPINCWTTYTGMMVGKVPKVGPPKWLVNTTELRVTNLRLAKPGNHPLRHAHRVRELTQLRQRRHGGRRGPAQPGRSRDRPSASAGSPDALLEQMIQVLRELDLDHAARRIGPTRTRHRMLLRRRRPRFLRGPERLMMGGRRRVPVLIVGVVLLLRLRLRLLVPVILRVLRVVTVAGGGRRVVRLRQGMPFSLPAAAVVVRLLGEIHPVQRGVRDLQS